MFLFRIKVHSQSGFRDASAPVRKRLRKSKVLEHERKGVAKF